MQYQLTHYLARWSTLLLLVLAVAALWQPCPGMAQSYSLKTLYTFNGVDFELPIGMAMDSQGNLYGNAYRGGSTGPSNNGLVYKYTPAGVFSVLAAFDGLDGDQPIGSPMIDAQGNLWGTTYQGGVDWHPEINHFGLGTVYKISSTGVFTPGILEFSGPHGANPVGVLNMDSLGNIIGATYQGGAPWDTSIGDFGTGTLFQFPLGGALSSSVLFEGANGQYPSSGIVIDTQGNRYGTTINGGTYSDGTLYKISPDGVLTTLVNFNGANGARPVGGLTIDSLGNVYGTTHTGGRSAVIIMGDGYGTIWKYSPTGGLTTLVSFNGTNGMFPFYGLTMDSQGNLFGSTVYGGTTGNGVVFEYSAAGVLSTLVDFDGPIRGANPYGPVCVDSRGNVYGVTDLGGASGAGTVFAVQPVSTTLAVLSVSVSPTTVLGGATAQGTVTISGPAPAGGTVVTLGSNDSSVTAQGPVTIPAGATTTTFTISTEAVIAASPVAISARLGNTTQQAMLTVTPPATTSIRTVTFDPLMIQGGVSTTGTLILDRVAPAGGAVVKLTSDTPSVTVPATVTVPAGSLTATFPVATRPVTVNTFPTFTITLGTSTLQAGILVAPPTPYIIGNFSVNLATVQGGTPLVGRVWAGGPFLPGNFTITLSSNNPAVVVPATVTETPDGAILGFPIKTTPVAQNTLVTLTASVGSSSQQVQVMLLAATTPTLSSLTTRPPDNGVGGFSAQGTVTLNSVAPAGGAVVTLSCTSSLVAMPATVGIPEGESTASFAIATKPVAAFTNILVTAAVGASTSQATFGIGPAAPPIVPASVTFNPPSVPGGTTSIAIVTFSAAAPASGTVVTLTSSTGSASVPASVLSAPGATSVGFTVSTTPVTTSTPATITATANGVTRQAILTITPANAVSLSSVTLNPTSVKGGNSSTGTVTLSAAAPSGGAVVTLSSSNTGFGTVPASVTVAAGKTSATFTVTTKRPNSNTSVTISAQNGTVTKTATLTVMH